MGEGRGKGGVGRGKGRGSTRLLGVLPAARRRQVGVHRVARALEEARRLRHAAAHAGPLLGRGFGRGCGAAAAVAEECPNYGIMLSVFSWPGERVRGPSTAKNPRGVPVPSARSASRAKTREAIPRLASVLQAARLQRASG